MQEVVFFKNYRGPKGKHLNCLTRTSFFGHDAKPELNRSIHPRVRNGVTSHRKVNTCKPSKAA